MYDRKIDGRELKFGVSGKLYQSNVLLYDKQSESLWSQLKEEAISGEMTGKRLTALPSVLTTWSRWRRDHPATLVLSPDTGYARPYDRDPYAGYAESGDLMFPPSRVDRRLPAKARVLGIEMQGDAVALPFERLAAAKTPFEIRIGGTEVTIRYDSATATAEALVRGKLIPAFTGYWFAWYAFHPQTKVWPDVSPAAAPAALGEASRIVVVEHQGRWASLGRLSPVGDRLAEDERGGFYVISGTLRNDSRQPVDFVELSYELLDDRGRVVLRDQGYNRTAETLRDSEGHSTTPLPDAARPPPIPPGATDSFRMFFFRDETPQFASYRIRVAAAPDGSTRPAGR